MTAQVPGSSPLSDSPYADLIRCLGDEVAKYNYTNNTSPVEICPADAFRDLDLEGYDARLCRCWSKTPPDMFCLVSGNSCDTSDSDDISLYSGPIGNGLKYGVL